MLKRFKIYFCIVFIGFYTVSLSLAICKADTLFEGNELITRSVSAPYMLERQDDTEEALKPLRNFDSPLETNPEIDYDEIKPNEMGQVMILMYHGLVKSEPHAAYMRTVDGFKKDLADLYEAGYRLVPLNDIIYNDINVLPGFSPVAFVFDDGMASSFSLVESDGSLVPKEDCAVDIMQKFAKAHPDFGNAATFALIGVDEPFKGAGTVEQRLKFLTDNGYDIANHTYSHPQLNKLDASALQREIGKQHNNLMQLLPEGYNISCLVYPYGLNPLNPLTSYALNGTYEGQEYEYEVALRAGPNSSSATPGHVKFDPVNVPRVRGSDNAEADLGWLIKYYKSNPEQRYVSDGDPNTISVPKSYEDKINKEDLRLKDKEIIIY